MAEVAACIEHQRRDIVSRVRLGDKDWYIQRYDVGGGHWQRALVVVKARQEEKKKMMARRDDNQRESGATEGDF